MKRTTTLGTLALILGLALTGCGSGDEGNQVASGGGAQPTTGTSSNPAEGLSRDEKGVKFAQCLREQGINVPDPEPGKGPMIKLDPSSGITKEKMDQAMEACKEFSPQGEGTQANPQQEENGRKYAVCMRENGVEKFPDPKPGQRGIMIDGSVGNDPDFQKAQEVCQPVLAGK
ncbi:hypothetical protein GCM10009789_71310 [Kribbella sancticallisti]|uniref:Subtilisin inhibitor-like n=1 Tax=Kribbella sancticallisti TaxID=460087 RepID=A0ABN2EH60_9ACTN